MWYEAYDKSYTSDLQARYCYAESSDGIHWDKPSLGIEASSLGRRAGLQSGNGLRDEDDVSPWRPRD